MEMSLIRVANNHVHDKFWWATARRRAWFLHRSTQVQLVNMVAAPLLKKN
jgi:hypothetical protein